MQFFLECQRKTLRCLILAYLKDSRVASTTAALSPLQPHTRHDRPTAGWKGRRSVATRRKSDWQGEIYKSLSNEFRMLSSRLHCSKAEAPMQVVHEGQEGKPVQTKDENLVSKVANAVGLGSTSDKVSQLLGQVYTDWSRSRTSSKIHSMVGTQIFSWLYHCRDKDQQRTQALPQLGMLVLLGRQATIVQDQEFDRAYSDITSQRSIICCCSKQCASKSR